MVFTSVTRVGLRAAFFATGSPLVAKPVPAVVASLDIERAPIQAGRPSVPRAPVVHTEIEAKVAPTPFPAPSRSSIAIAPTSDDNASIKAVFSAPIPNVTNADNLDMWQSMFNWTTLMMIITPKPQLPNRRKAKKPTPSPGPRPSSGSMGVFSWISFMLAAVQGFVSNILAFIRAPFCPRSPPLALLPHFIPPLPVVDVSLESGCSSSATSFSVPTNSTDSVSISVTPTVPIPPRVIEPAYKTPKPQAPTSKSQAPTKKSRPSKTRKALDSTARFRSVLADLEAQMQQHTFYDLDRELAQLDDQSTFGLLPLGNILSLKTTGVAYPSPPTLVYSPQSSPIIIPPPAPIFLPQAPPPTRCHNSIQVLPVIKEVEEGSPSLMRTPPYDASSWCVSRFNPLSGARAVGMAY